MSLNISSEKIDNPLLVELLRQLNRTFSKIGSEFFVIGATARDIILRVLANTSARRKTKDLDIAIAVTISPMKNEGYIRKYMNLTGLTSRSAALIGWHMILLICYHRNRLPIMQTFSAMR